MLLITGGGGMAMQALRSLLEESSIPHRAFLHRELDIADPEAVQKLLESRQIRWLVNGAAYTKVDGAESENVEAQRVNDQGPRVLARACAERGVPMLHLSTDYVFDGSRTTPYCEDDPPAPMSGYGRTKRAGEIGVLRASEKNLVIRTSGLYGAGGGNFVHAIIRQLRLGKPLRVVDDQELCPTWTVSLAGALVNLIEKEASDIVHFCDGEGCNWFEFTETILDEAFGRGWVSAKPELVAIKTTELQQSARRPPYSVLDCTRYEKLTGMKRDSWQTTLHSYLDSCTETSF